MEDKKDGHKSCFWKEKVEVWCSSFFFFLCSLTHLRCIYTEVPGYSVQTPWFRIKWTGSGPKYKVATSVGRVTWYNLLCWPSFASWQAADCCYHLLPVLMPGHMKSAWRLPCAVLLATKGSHPHSSSMSFGDPWKGNIADPSKLSRNTGGTTNHEAGFEHGETLK